jgi:hypothetical protein
LFIFFFDVHFLLCERQRFWKKRDCVFSGYYGKNNKFSIPKKKSVVSSTHKKTKQKMFNNNNQNIEDPAEKDEQLKLITKIQQGNCYSSNVIPLAMCLKGFLLDAALRQLASLAPSTSFDVLTVELDICQLLNLNLTLMNDLMLNQSDRFFRNLLPHFFDEIRHDLRFNNNSFYTSIINGQQQLAQLLFEKTREIDFLPKMSSIPDWFARSLRQADDDSDKDDDDDPFPSIFENERVGKQTFVTVSGKLAPMIPPLKKPITFMYFCSCRQDQHIVVKSSLGQRLVDDYKTRLLSCSKCGKTLQPSNKHYSPPMIDICYSTLEVGTSRINVVFEGSSLVSRILRYAENKSILNCAEVEVAGILLSGSLPSTTASSSSSSSQPNVDKTTKIELQGTNAQAKNAGGFAATSMNYTPMIHVLNFRIRLRNTIDEFGSAQQNEVLNLCNLVCVFSGQNPLRTPQQQDALVTNFCRLLDLCYDTGGQPPDRLLFLSLLVSSVAKGRISLNYFPRLALLLSCVGEQKPLPLVVAERVAKNVSDRQFVSAAASAITKYKSGQAMCANTAALDNGGGIHTLLVSTPGTGKSQMIQSIRRICEPEATVILGTNTTSAGLTGSDPKKYETGAFQVAKNGVLVIDEINCLDPSLYSELLTAFTDKKFILSKNTGQNIVNVKCSIVGTGNAIGNFIPVAAQPQKGSSENMQSMLSWFDIILVEDEVTKNDADVAIANAIIDKFAIPGRNENNQEEEFEEVTFSTPQMKQYINSCQKRNRRHDEENKSVSQWNVGFNRDDHELEMFKSSNYTDFNFDLSFSPSSGPDQTLNKYVAMLMNPNYYKTRTFVPTFMTEAAVRGHATGFHKKKLNAIFQSLACLLGCGYGPIGDFGEGLGMTILLYERTCRGIRLPLFSEKNDLVSEDEQERFRAGKSKVEARYINNKTTLPSLSTQLSDYSTEFCGSANYQQHFNTASLTFVLIATVKDTRSPFLDIWFLGKSKFHIQGQKALLHKLLDIVNKSSS